MTSTKENNRPTHTVWQVIGEDDKARWNRIGAAWPNRDGKGLSVKLDSFPLDGRIVLRDNDPKEAASQDGSIPA